MYLCHIQQVILCFLWCTSIELNHILSKVFDLLLLWLVFTTKTNTLCCVVNIWNWNWIFDFFAKFDHDWYIVIRYVFILLIKSVAYHPHVMFLHIWLKIARECVFLDVCWHLIDQFFWCKMALCTCAMVSVAFFSNEFFLDVPSADIYLQTTTFGHWFINWFESLS